MGRINLLIRVLLFSSISSNQNLIQARIYNAAVIEYAPTGSVFTQSPAELLGENLDKYANAINQAKTSNVDIIVFPEYGLTTLSLSSLSRLDARPFLQKFPSINSSVPQFLCDRNMTVVDDQLVYTSLSCSAQQNAIYVVANIGEVVPCIPGQSTPENEICPDDGAFQYSSNVVFDRNGRLIARYRKTHLFLEPLFQSPATPDVTFFSTDFGIVFGLFTCFDIMFYEPALSLYYEKGIRDFIFPTAWVDELPFLTAIQKQEAWSRFLGVSLLASNYHFPANGQIGSGIYSSAGAINYTASPTSGTFEVTAALGVSNDNSGRNVLYSDSQATKFSRWEEPHGMLYEDITNYSNIGLEIGAGLSTISCHEDLYCQLNYSMSCTNGVCDQYKLLSYSGFRTLGGGIYTVYIQLCGIVVCSDESLTSCAKPTVTQIAQIDELRLSGNFSSAQHVYPTAIDKELQLLPSGSIQFSNFGNGVFELTASRSIYNALSIGLYGRAYDKDI